MKLFEKIVFFLIPLSILFSSLTIIPNRILILLLLLFVLVRNGFFLNLLSKKKWVLFIGIPYILIILFGNPVLSKEAILFLTIPIYLLIYGYSTLTTFLLKKFFILAVFTYSVILLIVKSIRIITYGFSDFFQQEQWWNQLLYKNFTLELNAHPTYIAMFIITSLVMLLDQRNQSKKYFSIAKYTLIQAILFVVLFLLVVKISFVAILLIIILYIFFLLYKNKIKMAVICTLLLLLTSVTLYNTPGIRHRFQVNFNSIESSYSNLYGQNRLSERTALWIASLNQIKQHPIIGSSIQGIPSRTIIYPEVKSMYPELEHPKNCHNNFLEFGVRYGILGMILFLLFTILFLNAGIKKVSFEILGVWIWVFTFSFTESFMFREQGLSLVAILIAIFGIRLYGKDI